MDKSNPNTWKNNDVFSFRYNDEMVEKLSYPYHCFDGTMVVKTDNSGVMYLEDTYWGGSENRRFTPENAIAQGQLTFRCNLDEMVDIKDYDTVYYADEDVVELTIHAGYRNRYLIKEGTERSQAKMIETIKSKIIDTEHTIKYAQDALIRHKETLAKVEDGDTTVYL